MQLLVLLQANACRSVSGCARPQQGQAPTVPEKSRLRTRKEGRTGVRPSLPCGIR